MLHSLDKTLKIWGVWRKLFINQQHMECQMDWLWVSNKSQTETRKCHRCHAFKSPANLFPVLQHRSRIFMVNKELIECLLGGTQSQEDSATE